MQYNYDISALRMQPDISIGQNMKHNSLSAITATCCLAAFSSMACADDIKDISQDQAAVSLEKYHLSIADKTARSMGMYMSMDVLSEKNGNEKINAILKKESESNRMLMTANFDKEWRETLVETRSEPEENMYKNLMWYTTCDADAHVTADGSKISIIRKCTGFYGGAHGACWTRTSTFDTASGNLLTLDQVFGKANVLKAVLNALRKSKELEYFDEDNEERASKMILSGNIPWFIENDSTLVLRFDEYSIAPYAAGPTEVAIPLSDGKISVAKAKTREPMLTHDSSPDENETSAELIKRRISAQPARGGSIEFDDLIPANANATNFWYREGLAQRSADLVDELSISAVSLDEAGNDVPRNVKCDAKIVRADGKYLSILDTCSNDAGSSWHIAHNIEAEGYEILVPSRLLGGKQAMKALMISSISGTVPAEELNQDWRKNVEASLNYESALPWTIGNGFLTIEFSGHRAIRKDGQPTEIKLAFSEQKTVSAQ